ncbi:hypothetical protein OAT71_00875 [Flavobacteriales bacterium]|jgi:hypothetical protein|nr:hypothetical protein [Flavobacteriales bacterium]
MTAEEIKAHYKLEIEKAESAMEKNLLKAEMNHKLKLVDLNEDTNYQTRASESKFECIGCGS